MFVMLKMKIKYLRMSKKEKKEVKDKFYATDAGKRLKKSLKFPNICGILTTIFGVFLLIDAIINKLKIFDYIYAFVTLGFGIFFIIASRKIFVKRINAYVTMRK